MRCVFFSALESRHITYIHWCYVFDATKLITHIDVVLRVCANRGGVRLKVIELASVCRVWADLAKVLKCCEAYTTGFDAIKFQLEKQRAICATLRFYLQGYTRD